jgi:F0F1-type ATP synthase membrane subunit b/b'
MDTQLLIYLTIFLTALIGIVLGWVTISYRKLIEKYEKIRVSREEEEKALGVEREKVLAEAKVQAKQIVSDAQTRAGQLISEAASFGGKTQELLGKELQKVQAVELGYYQKALQAARQDASASLGGLSQDVKEEVIKQIDTVRTSLTGEIQKAQLETKQMLSASYKKMEEELAVYKAERMKKVDEKIFEILRDVAAKAIGKALSLEDHEDIVVKALEDAKKEHVL